MDRLDTLRARVAETLKPGMPEMHCWGCGRRVRLDKRKMTGSMAYALWRLFRYDQRHPGKPMDYRNWRARGEARNHTLMRWSDTELPDEALRGTFGGGWGLIEREGHQGRTAVNAGFWKITERGRRFVRGDIRVPKAIFTFNNVAYEFTRGTISMRKALGEKFYLLELLRDNEPE